MGNVAALETCCNLDKKAPVVMLFEDPTLDAGVQVQCRSGFPPATRNAAEDFLPPSARDVREECADDCEGDLGTDRCSSAAASDSTAASTTPDVNQAQQVVKHFVKSIVKGQPVSVLAVTGGVAECVVSLDRKLTTLSLQRAGRKDAKKRAVPLEDICEICVGEDAGEEVELPLDEHCVTLMLEDGNALGFQFDDLESRDTFALCLSMFVDGRRSEKEKQKKKEKARKGQKIREV